MIDQDLVRHLVGGGGLGGAGDPGDDAQHRSPASLDPRGAPAGGQGRRRAGLRRPAGHRVHAPWLREAVRGPDLPPDHHPGQPDRLGLRLCQRGPIHRRRREAAWDRGPGTGPVHPADPHRDGAHLLPSHLHGLVPARVGRGDAALLRPQGTGASARPPRGRHRRPLPPQLQPDRRGQACLRVGLQHPQGASRTCPQGSSPRPGTPWTRSWRRSTSSRTWSPATRSSWPGPRAIGILPPEVAASYGVSGPNLRASGVAFDLRKVENYLPYDRFDFEIPVGENGDCWDRWYVRLARDPTVGPDHPAGDRRDPLRPAAGQGAQDHQGSQGRDLRPGREPQGGDGLLPGLRAVARGRTGSRSARPASPTSRSCPGSSKGCWSPTSSRSWGVSTSCFGDVDR